ncbi:thiolase family protein [Sulfitobacter albidus]|uniref:Thiolase family protein n=1 Tax=Sulfitobacter albidus TaxID=2829501 RepID=A0A975PLJ2_9RHOB|nr:thiolase family protein [Sulfitobacter albidus]QUJ75842.1 thiolase family protein [Sulfitobacter albidus]
MTARLASARRTAVAPRGGAFAALSLDQLGAPVLRAALADAGLAPGDVDEVIVSNALGGGGNPARLVALAAGLPERVAGLSIDRQCAGGLDALLLARQMVLAGDARVVVAGGVESYSRRPQRLRTFADDSPPVPYDQPPFTPWPDRDPDMTEAAEALARHAMIDRAAQDAWAVHSHATAATLPRAEIVPLAGLDRDPFTRALSQRTAARAPVLTGSITAANTAVAADAAAFCVVVAEDLAPQAPRILGGASRGDTPMLPGLAPIAATRAALTACTLRITDIDIAEVMEAYAVQAIACVQGLGLDPAGVNRHGGALARGHPIGASGAINAVRLFHDLAPGQTGLATIAAAGGIATSLILRA